MGSSDIILKKIGIIHTPFRGISDKVPIQGRMYPGTEGSVELFPEYSEACRDLDGFSHVFLLYHFHACTEERLTARPYMDTVLRGVFSTRFPHRPNRIGMSLLEIMDIRDSIITVRDVDMIDGTPLVDIKPYVPRFDNIGVEKIVSTGWMTRYLTGERAPEISRTASREEWSGEDNPDEPSEI